ncbi:hypothetical protein CHS0354_006444 [Potamilus streckersoni]|uniref:Uncharacterized protein n=1 Tax=Potamilus streckersoni TaxID=2493646 RepID=A0AAE0W9I7_9BIVA|nr:hypothetical protein CHS0354_006444 [Potamilus streckersoni]
MPVVVAEEEAVLKSVTSVSRCKISRDNHAMTTCEVLVDETRQTRMEFATSSAQKYLSITTQQLSEFKRFSSMAPLRVCASGIFPRLPVHLVSPDNYHLLGCSLYYRPWRLGILPHQAFIIAHRVVRNVLCALQRCKSQNVMTLSLLSAIAICDRTLSCAASRKTC